MGMEKKKKRGKEREMSRHENRETRNDDRGKKELERVTGTEQTELHPIKHEK